MKKIFLIGIVAIIAIGCICGVMVLVGYRQYMKIETVEIDPQLEVFLGGGGNSLVLTAEDGARALVVDTKMGSAAKALRKKVRTPQLVLVATHAHQDHIGGNTLYPGAQTIAGAYTREQWEHLASSAPFPQETVPVGGEKVLQIGSETVHVLNVGPAHTWDDVVVYLEKRKMLMTGDLVFNAVHPALYRSSGCSVSGWVAALDTLSRRYEIRSLLPGHGLMTDGNGLSVMKGYFASIRDARNDPAALPTLKKRYASYASIPGMASFKKTVAFMKDEFGK